MLKKIEYTKSNLLNKKIENIFTCPICHSNIKIYKNSLICEKNHCYDIAKKGYFTLFKKNKLRIDNIYDINLFKNRNKRARTKIKLGCLPTSATV